MHVQTVGSTAFVIWTMVVKANVFQMQIVKVSFF